MSDLITLAIERRWTKKYFKIKTPVLVHLRWGSFFILHFKHLGFSTETSLEDSIKSINADILGLKFILYESVWHFKIYFSLYGSCVKYGSNWMPHSIVLVICVFSFDEYSSNDDGSSFYRWIIEWPIDRCSFTRVMLLSESEDIASAKTIKV